MRSRIPHIGTPALRDFLETWARLGHLFNLILMVVHYLDKLTNETQQILKQLARNEEELERYSTMWPEGGRLNWEALTRNRRILLEVMFSRQVDNYLNYLSSLLFEICVQRPETLRSSNSSIDIETVLDHQSIKGLVRTIAKKRVASLSYTSFKDLSDYFERNFRIKLVQSHSLATVVEAIEIRNISVHNRCIMDERYVSRTGTPQTEIGKKKKVTAKHLLNLTGVLVAEVTRLDKSARKRLKLKGIRFDVSASLREDDPLPD